MGKKYDRINQRLQDFIERQKIFFTATAASEGRINLSPKGMDTFRVLDSNRVMWLNLTGSGNETAAHLLQNDRITIMFCAFEGVPMILRLYGRAVAYHPGDAEFDKYIGLFPEIAGTRQLFDVAVELVQTSCGMGVPLMDFRQHRDELRTWAEELGEDGIADYQERKNQSSIDGLPTRLPVKN
ncbi:pyridoxamine 5'-phosphate oxidase family protein [Robertkochia aurantiaca]|uniref:pyridoxamine 5'-phosphate oxidase family protein n=1 Tax=Robertkochia aurantiaca TaxID=2873700 RepID=UPI001CCE0AA0|nr:pyridoxamine 5'-phosphate oxidase family protein [Robertkochia sp. 3YJGBD-33]